MRHLSMCKTHFCERNTLSLTLSPRVKVIANNRIIKQRNKNIPPLNKQCKALLGNCSATDESNRL